MYIDEETRLDDGELELQIRLIFQEREIPKIVREPLLEFLSTRFDSVSNEDRLWADRNDNGSVIGRKQLQERIYPAIQEAAKELATTVNFRQYEAFRNSGILK